MRDISVLIITLAFLISCEKENDKVKRVTYFPLEIGNYWIYQHFDIDSLGNETLKSIIDSVIISRDTLINAKKYFVLEGIYYPYTAGRWEIVNILRDSSGYLVNQNGKILFSEDNFADTLDKYYFVEHYSGDTLYYSISNMVKVNEPVTVPAGTFNVLNYKRSIYTAIDYPGISNPRYWNTYYTKNIGIILETYFYLQGTIISEKRLLRFHIEE